MDTKQKEIESQALVLKAEAESFEIVSQETYNQANEFGRRIKQSMKVIDEYCDPVIAAAHKAHKTALKQKKALYAPFEAAKKIIDAKQIAWYRAEQARAEEERRKAEEEARRRPRKKLSLGRRNFRTWAWMRPPRRQSPSRWSSKK
jgi:LmbE family N-acetylglucosaminyl deacetylase